MLEIFVVVICLSAVAWGLHQRQAILSRVENKIVARPARQENWD